MRAIVSALYNACGEVMRLVVRQGKRRVRRKRPLSDNLPGAIIIGIAAEVQDMKCIWEVYRLVISLGL